jgi:hypothetical protein
MFVCFTFVLSVDLFQATCSITQHCLAGRCRQLIYIQFTNVIFAMTCISQALTIDDLKLTRRTQVKSITVNQH